MMRIIPFRHLQYAQLEPLLLQEKEEWEHLLEWDFHNVILAFRSMLPSRLLPGLALLEDDCCVGYLYVVQREMRCIIGGLYFQRELRDSRWPKLLLERQLAELSLTASSLSVEGQITFPGPEQSLRGVLEEEGFHVMQRSFRRLTNLSAEVPAAPDHDFLLRPLHYADIDAMALLMTTCYRDHIDGRVSALYATFRGCSFLLNQLILKDGCGAFQPWCSFTAHLRNELIGVIVVSRISERSFFVSQIFIHPRQQKKGYGRYLLYACIDRIARRAPGAHLALTVTRDNTKAMDWYERIGFTEVTPNFSFMRPPPETELSPD
ncbi:MAG: GNAT family N-acetyltransferase [Acidobacteria bacterium]|nr:GNAT family N-acetyltransferase [Acidobacteriota bacterium]